MARRNFTVNFTSRVIFSAITPGLGSVAGTPSGVTGGLQNGGSITTPLSGLNGG